MTDETIIPITALELDPRNARKRTPRSSKVIGESLQEFGPLRSLVGQRLPDGRIVVRAGNGTLEEAGQIGIDKVRIVERRPDELVVVVADDLDETQWTRYAIADNRASDLSIWDAEVLEILDQEIDLEPFFLGDELNALMAGLAGDSEGLVESLEPMEGLTDDNAIPEEVETRVKRGDIWQLGRHRVMCGDSTVITDVERLMDGQKANMVFTSPPYNAGKNAHLKEGGDYKAKNDNFYQDKGGHKDSMDSDEYKDFCFNILSCLSSITKDDAPICWNVAYNANSRSEYGEIVFSGRNPFTVKETIIWDKGSSFNISSKGILSRTCEFIFLMSRAEKYYTNQGENEAWYNVWRISSQGSSHDSHKACFPVELPMEGISRFCRKRGLLMEPFLGSGTTLIACEKTGRTCYGMELSEKYCDVILKRWEDFTGKEAVLLK